jgi:hypothetical protein
MKYLAVRLVAFACLTVLSAMLLAVPYLSLADDGPAAATVSFAD